MNWSAEAVVVVNVPIVPDSEMVVEVDKSLDPASVPGTGVFVAVASVG